MNKKLFTLFMIMLSIMLVPVNVKGVRDVTRLPPHYYYWRPIEAGHDDRVTWEFECWYAACKIELYLMNSVEFQRYREWDTASRLYDLGERLTGSVSEGSGEFRPSHSDTWYFIFHNSGLNNCTTHVDYEIIVHENYYILVPTVIILVIVVISGIIGGFVYLRKSSRGSRSQKFVVPKKKEKKQKSDASVLEPALIEEPQEPKQQEPPKTIFKICPECGTNIMNRNAKFCSNCAHEFKKEE